MAAADEAGGASGSAPASGASSVEAKLAKAQALKAKGNALFQAGDVGDAHMVWFEMVGVLTSLDRSAALADAGSASAFGELLNSSDTGGRAAPQLTPAQEALMRELLLSAHLNMAAAMIKARARARVLRARAAIRAQGGRRCTNRAARR